MNSSIMVPLKTFRKSFARHLHLKHSRENYLIKHFNENKALKIRILSPANNSLYI